MAIRNYTNKTDGTKCDRVWGGGGLKNDSRINYKEDLMGFFRGELYFDVVFNFDLFLSTKQEYIFLQNCFQILSVCVALSDAL